ncbi:SDR family oxidoreductase [Chloroflexota bacterium]
MNMEGYTKAILILGGTGHFGRHIVRSLLEKGQHVRILNRNSDKARRILGDKVDILEGDIRSRESVVEALRGVKAVVISVSAMTPKLIRELRLIESDSVLITLEEAQHAGISRVVYISIYDIREDFLKKMNITWEIPEIKKEVEDTLAKSHLNWTVLGAAPSMEIFFSMIRGNTMMVPGGGPPSLPNVSSRDVGEIAAQTVLRDDLNGKRIRITGPEALSFSDAAKRIESVTRKTFQVRKIPLFPLRIASVVALPFTPYLRHLVTAIKLMNNYPQHVAAIAAKDHQWLVNNFKYIPNTLEMEAKHRFNTQDTLEADKHDKIK